MYIELKELFINRNYKGYVDKVYFDRKKYTIVDSSFYNEHKNDDKYERYIPLFEVDEEQIQDDFIREFNNKRLHDDYFERTMCFEKFATENDLWRLWCIYYDKTVYKIAEDWCQENHIRFKNSDLN